MLSRDAGDERHRSPAFAVTRRLRHNGCVRPSWQLCQRHFAANARPSLRSCRWRLAVDVRLSWRSCRWPPTANARIARAFVVRCEYDVVTVILYLRGDALRPLRQEGADVVAALLPCCRRCKTQRRCNSGVRAKQGAESGVLLRTFCGIASRHNGISITIRQGKCLNGCSVDENRFIHMTGFGRFISLWPRRVRRVSTLPDGGRHLRLS